MTRLESEKKQINKADKAIFEFLTDFNSFEKLMPERVINWRSTTDTCSFTIQGTAGLGMQIIERQPNTLIKIADHGNVPFKFNLNVNIESTGMGTSLVQFVFDADMDPMLKMMASRPLTNFLNMLVDKLQGMDF
ncbi:MAG: SRPBCC family protein [Bacteroidetes bacterium]|nr:SRPBCC family protein [Bacteroidota bacterium]